MERLCQNIEEEYSYKKYYQLSAYIWKFNYVEFIAEFVEVNNSFSKRIIDENAIVVIGYR